MPRPHFLATDVGRFLSRTLACLLVLAALTTPTESASAEDDKDLEALLDRLSRTASLFRDFALNFVALETIQWSGMGIDPGSETYEYVFVHDEQEFRDFRTTTYLGKRRSVPAERDPEDRGVPRYLRSAYLWILTFHEKRQPLHRYRILGEEDVDGRRAVMISFEPLPPVEAKVNDWHGVAWVDPELGQLLKVVAQEPAEREARRQLEQHREAGLVDAAEAEFETITTLFTEEKNGLRFPSKVILERARYVWEKDRKSGKTRRKVTLRVVQTYRKYRFFSVQTVDEIRGYILEGPDPDESP